MPGAHGRSVEREQAPALKDAIDNGVREVVVMQHVSPGRERFVRGEEHGPLPAMAVVDDVEEHVGGIGAVGQVADFVDHEHVRLRVRGERVREPTGAKRGGEIVDDFGQAERFRYAICATSQSTTRSNGSKPNAIATGRRRFELALTS